MSDQPTTDVRLAAADAAELAGLLRCLRDWIDAEENQLDPLLAKHGYDIIGLRVDLDRFASLLTPAAGEVDF